MGTQNPKYRILSALCSALAYKSPKSPMIKSPTHISQTIFGFCHFIFLVYRIKKLTPNPSPIPMILLSNAVYFLSICLSFFNAGGDIYGTTSQKPIFNSNVVSNLSNSSVKADKNFSIPINFSFRMDSIITI